ncbi:DsbA family oxidoreductase [Xenorhabdus thailandensis]|uniref:DsbA family oxidoreductase n=1 Tax=Xenorhabdus thailandensis TaxID=3136255 RepID=UPI0030F417A8
MPDRLQIEFVSDVSCTWCAVGLRNLELALKNLGDDIKIEIRFQPFELNPQMPAGGQNLIEHLQEKYGWDRQRTLETLTHICRSGEPIGIDFRLGEESRIYNTFDAHRLLHWAGLHGRQKELKQALFTAHFTDDDDPGDHTLLVRLAESVGLDAAEACTVLASGSYAQEVRDDEQTWRDAGVDSVPTIVFNSRYALTGAQPPEIFEQAMRRVITDTTISTQAGTSK